MQLRLTILSATAILATGCTSERTPQPRHENGPSLQTAATPLVAAAPPGAASPLSAMPTALPNYAWLWTATRSTTYYTSTTLALDSEYALFGTKAAGSHGAALVFFEGPSGWEQTATLEPNFPEYALGFGYAVALRGPRALVGAPDTDLNGLTATGTGYIFERAAASWTEAAELVPTNPQNQARLGRTVALANDSAFMASAGQAIRRFTPQGTAWVEAAPIVPNVGDASGAFGSALVADGDRLVVGAMTTTVATVAQAGAAYIFERNATSWSESAVLNAPTPGQHKFFGRSLAMDGDRIIAGADNAAYIFERNAASWEHAATLASPDPTAPLNFGSAVSIHGERALVAASMDVLIGQSFPTTTGAAGYLFVLQGEQWVAKTTMLPSPQFGQDLVGGVALGERAAMIESLTYSVRQLSTVKVAISAARGLALFGAGAAGSACNSSLDCGTAVCVEGLCCDSACTGACERCDIAGKEGSCTPAPHTEPGTPSCNPYVCNGITANCPAACGVDSDCASSHRCAAGTCVQKKPLAELCTAKAECASGHCSDGHCCDTACAGACDRCDAPDGEGTCGVMVTQSEGTPSCAPYRCDGASATCPSQCQDHADCGPGHHCAGNRCTANYADGQACDAAALCETGFCTDGLCCSVESCAPYRCTVTGSCQQRCQSNAACIQGYECTSQGDCVPTQRSSTETAVDSGCTISPSQRKIPRDKSWLLLLGAGWLLNKRRRGRPHPR